MSNFVLCMKTRGGAQRCHIEVSHRKGVAERFVGLLGSRRMKPGFGLLLNPCRRVHTFFMNRPVDCIGLDREGTVTDVRNSVSPWRVFAFGVETHMVLELEAGEARRIEVRIGDRASTVSPGYRTFTVPTGGSAGM